MNLLYNYASPSICYQEAAQTILGFSSDLLRDERVSFIGRLKHHLIYRDAMLVLREIVVSDLRSKTKERPEFFAWLNQEIEKRVLNHEKYMSGIREELKTEIQKLKTEGDYLNSQILETRCTISDC